MGAAVVAGDTRPGASRPDGARAATPARRSLSWLLLALAGVAVAPGVAVAATPSAAASEPTYDVARGCPARAVWLSRVGERLPDAAAAHAALERLPVHIEASAGGYRGWVGGSDVAGPGASEPSSERRVQGRACGEVFDALVLIAALSLEASVDGAAVEAAPGESLASIVVSDDPVEPRLAGGAADPGELAVPPSGGDRVQLGALGFAQVQTAIAPAAALDMGVGLVATWRDGAFDPWLLFGVYMGAAPQVSRVERATARFEHWSARALGCPWRFPRDGLLALRPCLGLDVGRSRGEGFGVAGASARSAPWLAGLAELRLDVTLATRVTLGASGGALLPLVRPRYYFEPGVVAYDAAPVGFAASSFAALLF